MKRLTIDFLVGLFVLIGILCLIFLSFKVTNGSDLISSDQSYTLKADFDNVGSLKVDAPVKVSGFVVGRVNNIILNTSNYKAEVFMDINQRYRFSTDTSAQILTTGLLGEQYIGLQSGADSTMLDNNGTITITSSALVLEDLIGKFMTNISK